LSDASSRRARVFAYLAQLLRVRAAHPAFDPYGEMGVLDLDPSVFALQRGDQVLCLQNVSAQARTVELSGRWQDVLTGKSLQTNTLTLLPYQVRWLAREKS